MSTRRTRAKPPKKPKTSAADSQTAKSEAGDKNLQPLPSAEWIAEMVIRILGDDLHPERRRAKRAKTRNVFQDLEDESTRNSAVCEALQIYRAAQQELARCKKVPPPLPLGLTTKERTSGHVTFERGCKLITGEERRDRAEEKYIIWREWDMGQTDNWDGMPEVEQGFSLTYLASANAAYEKYFKKALACHKRQKRKNSGQKGKKG